MYTHARLVDYSSRRTQLSDGIDARLAVQKACKERMDEEIVVIGRDYGGSLLYMRIEQTQTEVLC